MSHSGTFLHSPPRASGFRDLSFPSKRSPNAPPKRAFTNAAANAALNAGFAWRRRSKRCRKRSTLAHKRSPHNQNLALSQTEAGMCARLGSYASDIAQTMALLVYIPTPLVLNAVVPLRKHTHTSKKRSPHIAATTHARRSDTHRAALAWGPSIPGAKVCICLTRGGVAFGTV